MKKNFTPCGKLMLTVATLVFMLFATVNVKAQNTDLPNPDPNIQTAPAGTLVIAMDNTNQANPGYFNLKAYGLVVTLMDFSVRLRWVITAGKAKDGVDINVNAISVTTPTVLSATSQISYTSGSPVATLSNVAGTLLVGMSVTSSAAGIPVGTKILNIINPTTITLSNNATSTQSNKNATYALNTYPELNYNFKAGPFIILPSDTAGVMTLINMYNNTQTTANRVNVFKTTASISVDIRYDMNNIRPKAAILEDGGNANIHVNYMIRAGVPTMNYAVLTSATGLSANCYTFASEPHNGLQGSMIDSIKVFVLLGGNFLAQCHAITSYENWTGGHFQSTQGMNGNNNNIGTNINYINNDLSLSQYEGMYNANQGGNTQTWTFPAGSLPQNNFYGTVKGNTTAFANSYGASGAKLRTGRGGNVYFLGNHNFNSNNIEELNGVRMYLNAFLTPAHTSFCDAPRVLASKLGYFAAKKINDKQVQLSWNTLSEQDTKEFIIERSADGIHFSEITRVAATGNSSVEVKYSTNDYSPLNGKNFYRFIQTDINGARYYSSIVIVNMNQQNSTIDIYPNPAREQVTVNFNNMSTTNNILSVTDISGKPVINNLAVSGSVVKLNVSHLEPGIYIVNIVNSYGARVQNKLIVMNK